MKNIKENLIELGKNVLATVSVWAIVIGIIVGLYKLAKWQEQRDSYKEIAYQEKSDFISTDGGYYSKKETLSMLYGNGDTITRTSLTLTPTKTNTFFSDSTAWSGITFWDYDNDGKWDRLFFCGYPKSVYGANSIEFNGNINDWRQWEWSPCPANKDMKPIDACDVSHALALVTI